MVGAGRANEATFQILINQLPELFPLHRVHQIQCPLGELLSGNELSRIIQILMGVSSSTVTSCASKTEAKSWYLAGRVFSFSLDNSDPSWASIHLGPYSSFHTWALNCLASNQMLTSYQSLGGGVFAQPLYTQHQGILYCGCHYKLLVFSVLSHPQWNLLKIRV